MKNQVNKTNSTRLWLDQGHRYELARTNNKLLAEQRASVSEMTREALVSIFNEVASEVVKHG